jgi:hypothetical protein
MPKRTVKQATLENIYSIGAWDVEKGVLTSHVSEDVQGQGEDWGRLSWKRLCGASVLPSPPASAPDLSAKAQQSPPYLAETGETEPLENLTGYCCMPRVSGCWKTLRVPKDQTSWQRGGLSSCPTMPTKVVEKPQQKNTRGVTAPLGAAEREFSEPKGSMSTRLSVL